MTSETLDSQQQTDASDRNTVLVTGGAGYIGSHTILCLLEKDYNVVVVDNLCNSSKVSLDRVADIAKLGNERKERLVFHQVDLRSEKDLRRVFESSPKFVSCIHFAGLKAVGESVDQPLLYYENNLTGTLNLLRLMDEYDCHSIIFSSSATVYGEPSEMPLTENAQVGQGITNPYGRSKYMLEEILKDFYISKNKDNNTSWSVVLLRYFNPIGAHSSGLIGEDPNGIPNNLMPYIAQVAVGKREYLTIFGDDYPTRDGTGVRDYIHVVDLAEGHIAAMDYTKNGRTGCFTFNLGTGHGYSVLEMVRALEEASGRKVDYKIGNRRTGDIAECYADPALAKRELNWQAKRGLQEMCRDTWLWQSQNPNGYKDSKAQE